MTVRANKPAFSIREKLKELQKPIGLKGSELMRSETVQEARELVGAGRKNILINGSMQIYQRASSASTGTGSSGTYRVHDRWYIRNANMGNFTVSNGSDLSTGFSNYIRWECTTADASPSSGDFLYMQQAIEGYNVQQLKKGTPNAQYSTLSFWVKSSEVGIFTVQIYDGSNGRSCVKRYTIDSADTWEYKTLLIPPDTTGTITNDNGARYFTTFWLGSGTNKTTGTNQLDRWASTVGSSEASGQTGNIASSVGSYIQFTQVQYEVGKNATEFEHRSYGEELALCQRYYNRVGSGNVFHGRMNGGSVADYSYFYPVTMRIAPQGNSGFNTASAEYGAIGLTVTNVVVNDTGTHSATIRGYFSNSGTSGYGAYLKLTGTTYVEFNAEL